MICYKIKNKDGKFSSGGEHPHFSSFGHVWNSKSALKLHLLHFINDKSKRSIYENCTIVEYEMIENFSESVIEKINVLEHNYNLTHKK